MPWRAAEYDGEFPSLGWEIHDWAAEYLRVPDGPLAGDPLELTDEQLTILVRFYGLDERGRFLWRRAAVRRAQGWGKSPLLAVIGLAELAGPARFDGWDADGEPVGVLPVAPWVQVAACSEDQTDNTYAAAYTMAQESELAATVIDVGLTRMFRRDGPGRLEPVTSAAGTRLGQRITFAVLDETHLWTRRNGGIKLAATIRRNAGKMNGRTFESTNAHLVGEDSVAERSYLASQKAAAGLLYDSVEAPHVDNLDDFAAVRAALDIAYGEARWVDRDRLAAEIADPSTDPEDARRFYFNQLTSGTENPFDLTLWPALARDFVVEEGTVIGAGFDGSISDDQTVLYACTREGFVFEIAAWSRPPDVSDYRVPRLEVHDAVREMFSRYRVGRMFCDPAKWWTEIEAWSELYGEEQVIVLDTNSPRRFAPACDRFATAIREATITHDGKPGLTRDLSACGRKKVRVSDDDEDGRTPFVIVKADTRKIDRAVGAVLALHAAMSMELDPEPTGLMSWA